MQVILAESAGFCYGVKRAVELAQKTAAETQGCWMLGDLVGLGTLICAFCLGPVIQFCNGHFSEKVLRYQPRKT